MRKIWDLIVGFIKKNKEIIVPSATLLVICLVATLLLGVTNLLTAGQIAKLEEALSEEEKESMVANIRAYIDTLSED